MHSPIPVNDIQRILVRATNWVGDAVMTLPALEALGGVFPQASLTVLARPWVGPIYESHPAVHQVLTLNKDREVIPRISETLRVVRRIRSGRYDLAVLFQNAFEAALLAFLGRIPFRLGYRTDGRRLLLSHPIPRSTEILSVHQVDYYLSLLRAVGWDAPEKDPVLRVTARNRELALQILVREGIQPGEPLVGMAPGAVYGGAKRWPEDRFSQIGNRLARLWGARVLLFGSPGEAAICDRVAHGMDVSPVHLGGRTDLGTAIGLIHRCAFFVTNDSGLMHVAAALGIPTVAIFGSTDVVTTGPRGPDSVVVQNRVHCAPCLKPECPTDHRCMLSVQVDQVWEALEGLRVDRRPDQGKLEYRNPKQIRISNVQMTKINM